MLYNCIRLKNVKLDRIDTKNVKSMRNLFSGCIELESLDLSNFNTSNVTDMCYMFANCKKLSSLDLKNFDTYKVKKLDCMFIGCISLKYLDISSFNMEYKDDRKRCSINSMFMNCTIDNLVVSDCKLKMEYDTRYIKNIKR